MFDFLVFHSGGRHRTNMASLLLLFKMFSVDTEYASNAKPSLDLKPSALDPKRKSNQGEGGALRHVCVTHLGDLLQAEDLGTDPADRRREVIVIEGSTKSPDLRIPLNGPS